MREEATLSAKEKESTKAKAKPKEKGAAPARDTGRMKIVWAVCAPNGQIVKTFLYPEKGRADDEAARLTTEKGQPHRVRQEKVPLE